MKIQEKQYGFEVQDLCIIRLSRYAYSSLHRYAERFNNGRSGAAKSARQDYDQFYLLDYFDGLTYQKDKYGTLQFENCMGLEVPSLEGILHHKKNNTTAIQSWSLVRLKSDSTYFSDPFLYQSKDPAHLSDKPFLAIIAVTINPEHYYMWTKHHPNKSARGFIQECLESIERKVRSADTTDTNPLTGVFMSVNYGDFCVIVRTSDISDAYMISGKLSNADKADDKYTSSSPYDIRFSTFTTIGIETGMLGNIPLSITGDKLTGNHAISLDLVADSSILQFLTESAKKNGVNGVSMPMVAYGRHNISVRLTLTQFNEIYPLLCHYKLNMGTDINIIPKPSIKDEIVNCLDNALRSKKIHVINERPLLHHGDIDNNNYRREYLKDYDVVVDRFIIKLNYLRDEIESVANKAHLLPSNRNAFQELMRLVKELYKTYIPMWYQHDSRINVYMIYKILFMVVGAAKSYIAKIDELQKMEKSGGIQLSEEAENPYKYADLKQSEETDSNETSRESEGSEEAENPYKPGTLNMRRRSAIQILCNNLLDSLNQAVYQINSLSKVLQGIKLQTIQMPNYEIQTQVDLEKYVVAFTEFLREFSSSYYQKFNGDNRLRIMPFITMDLTTKKVGANPLFHAIIPPEFNHTIPHTAELLNIIIPSFECLARGYDLLLLLCHEIIHSFRFTTREERNRFLVGSIINRMSEYIASQWLSTSSPDQNFLNVDSMIEFISGAIKDSLIENSPLDEWIAYPMLYLETNMTDFFLNNVFTKRDRHTTTNPVKPPVDTITDALKLIYSKTQGVNDPEYIKVTKDYMSLIHLTDENKELILNNEFAKTLKELIRPHLQTGTALEEFYRSRDFAREIKIKICDVDTLLPTILGNKKAIPILNFLNTELSKRNLLIDNGMVCMKSLFIKDICTDLKYFASQNLFFELRDYLLTGSPLSPCGLIMRKIDNDPSADNSNIKETIADIEKALNELYKKIRVLEISFSNEHENELSEACKSLGEKLSSLCNLKAISLTTEEKKKLMMLIEIAKEKVMAFAQTICDISYQYICATKITNDYPSGIPICSDHIRQRIIRSIHSRLNVEYSGNGLLTDSSKMVLTSSQVYTMLSGLCINSDCHESFSENLRKCFFSFSDTQISDMVQSFIRNYREIVADLGMCAALALDAFGYLKFYVRYYHRVRPLAEDLSHDMMSERAVAVIHTLMQSGGSPEENLLLLKEKAKEYIRHTFKYTGHAIVQDIRTELRQNSALNPADISRFNNARKAFFIELFIKEKEYQDYLKKLGSANEADDELEPCFDFLVKRFKEIFNYLKIEESQTAIIPGFDEKCMNMLINKYFERFDRLYYMLSFFLRVLRPFINKDELDHLKSLYCNTIRHKTNLYCSWERPDSETDARRAVSNYFNSSNPYKKKHTSIVLKKTFAFILEYYYKNRLAYSKDPTFDDEWIIDLTGGKE